MKKLQLIFIVMLLPMLANAFTGEAEINGIKYYIITKGQTAEVRQKKYTGDIVIPSSIEYEGVTCSVASIGEKAFYKCSELTSVTIPNSVSSIGASAFSGCSSLSTVTIPKNVTSIGDYTFNGCNSLTNFTIPNSVTDIGSYAFAYCSNLTNITIPNSVVTIGGSAFSNCSSLSDVYCYSEKVPYTYDAFYDSPIKSATLHTPNKSIHLYKQSSPWSGFGSFAGLYGSEYALSYTIDGSEYKSYNFWEDEKISPEDDPTKEGYTFSGWSEIPETMPAHDVTVTGTFSINSYKLTYTVDGEEYKSTDVEFGSTITPEIAPTKEGYTFSGWSEIPETMPSHDVTVTGTFSINSYKLIYTVDGEGYKSTDVEFGSTITPEIAPTKEGYTFSGWSEIPETMPSHDVTVTGTFSINCYKLTYMFDGVVFKETMYDYGATVNPEPQPEGDYATFEWADLPQTMPAYDVVVHASYTTGFIEVQMATPRNLRIYSLNGTKLDKPHSGLNIVVLENGAVKKVMVK